MAYRCLSVVFTGLLATRGNLAGGRRVRAIAFSWPDVSDLTLTANICGVPGPGVAGRTADGIPGTDTQSPNSRSKKVHSQTARQEQPHDQRTRKARQSHR
jgi:hypothetical protein